MIKTNRYILMMLGAVCLCITSACDNKTNSDAATPVAAVPSPSPISALSLSSPEKPLLTFISALNKADVDTALACVEGAKSSEFSNGLKRFFADQTKQRRDSELMSSNASLPLLEASDLHTKMDGDKATLTYTFIMRGPDAKSSNEPNAEIDTVQVERGGDGSWRLVPETSIDDSRSGASSFVKLLAFPTYAAHSLMATAIAKSDAASSLMNMKQVCLAAMGYAVDHKDRLPSDAASFQSTIRRDMKSDADFSCPQHKMAFSMNKNLENIKIWDISDSRNTVMFYEGESGKLNYNHLDKAVIGFADGSCRLISEDQAQSLIWKPSMLPSDK